MIGLLGQLFWTFFIIGLFNFGGGGAMLSLIQAQVVANHGWISQELFADIVGISQSTPGPIGINCATYVGYEVLQQAGYGQWLGIFGSATATFAVVLPSFLVFFVIVKIFNKVHESRTFATVMTILRPAVAGLIGAAGVLLIVNISGTGISLITSNFPNWKAWLILAASFLLAFTRKAGPIAIIIASGVLGLIIF